MRDEEYLFHQDVREKKHTGYSARKQRSHCGKAGCKLPSDYLTKKELLKMNGKVESYRLNEPMTFEEFKSMPDDIQKIYLTALREKYNVSDTQVAKMLYTSQATLRNYLVKKGLNRSGKWSGKEEWDKEGFYAWAYGIPKQEEPVDVVEEIPVEETPVEEVVQEDVSPEQEEEILEILRDETPAIEECPYKEIPNPGIKVNLIREEAAPAIAVPKSGNMSFEGSLPEIVNTLEVLLGNRNVKFAVRWEVVD